MADTSQADYAIALTLGKYCEPENRAFIDCKELNEGKHIANCVEPMNNVLLCSSAVYVHKYYPNQCSMALSFSLYPA